MAIAIEVYHDDARHCWTGVVSEHPATNASGETLPELLRYMAVAWNRDFPELEVHETDTDQWHMTLLFDRPSWA